MKVFKPIDIQNKLSLVFNTVQSEGKAIIDSRSRPDMVLILKSDYDADQEKIKSFSDALKK